MNGNPYAQIDPNLKKQLRVHNYEKEKEFSLKSGIEDLDGLLGDLGYTTSGPDLNANTYVKVTTSSPKNSGVDVNGNHTALVMEGDITAEQNVLVMQLPISQQRHVLSSDSSVDEVFSVHSSTNTVNDLLYELDNSTLNSSNGMRRSKKNGPNSSVYDNDSVTDFIERRESTDGIMEIQAGTVAQHVKNLNKVLFKETSEYTQKYGVPLAGVNDATIVEAKVTAFNSRSVAPGYCSPSVPRVYHSLGGSTKVNYEHKDEVDGDSSGPMRKSCRLFIILL